MPSTCDQLTCEHCGKRFSRRSTLEQHVALHGATSSSDWEEIQDAALHDLEQAAAFGALELSFTNFAAPSSPPGRFAGSWSGPGEGKEEHLDDSSFSAVDYPSGSLLEVKKEDSPPGVSKAKGSAGHPVSGSRCGTCGKIFTRQSLLNRHLKLHAGIKPYLCTVSTYFMSLLKQNDNCLPSCRASFPLYSVVDTE